MSREWAVKSQNLKEYERKKVKSLSRVQLFEIPWTTACEVPPPMGCPGKSTGVGCHFLLQGIFPTQGWNPGLPHGRRTLYHLSHRTVVAAEGPKSIGSGVCALLLCLQAGLHVRPSRGSRHRRRHQWRELCLGSPVTDPVMQAKWWSEPTDDANA